VCNGGLEAGVLGKHRMKLLGTPKLRSKGV